MTQLRVLVDDDPLVRTGLSTILGSAEDIEVAGEATDGDEAVTRVRATAPDVVLVDIRMRRMDGLAATRAVTATTDPPKVLVLTTYDLDEYVRTVAKGDVMLSPGTTRKLVGHFVAARAHPRRQRTLTKLSALSEREREVVTAVAQGKSNADTAGELLLSGATVKTHITRTFAKTRRHQPRPADGLRLRSGHGHPVAPRDGLPPPPDHRRAWLLTVAAGCGRAEVATRRSRHRCRGRRPR